MSLLENVDRWTEMQRELFNKPHLAWLMNAPQEVLDAADAYHKSVINWAEEDLHK